jgi:hypothetical protein
MAKGVKGSGAILGVILVSSLRNFNKSTRHLSGGPLSGQRFEIWTSQIRSRVANYYTAKFWVDQRKNKSKTHSGVHQ